MKLLLDGDYPQAQHQNALCPFSHFSLYGHISYMTHSHQLADDEKRIPWKKGVPFCRYTYLSHILTCLFYTCTGRLLCHYVTERRRNGGFHFILSDTYIILDPFRVHNNRHHYQEADIVRRYNNW